MYQIIKMHTCICIKYSIWLCALLSVCTRLQSSAILDTRIRCLRSIIASGQDNVLCVLLLFRGQQWPKTLCPEALTDYGARTSATHAHVCTYIERYNKIMHTRCYNVYLCVYIYIYIHTYIHMCIERERYVYIDR